MALEKEKHTRKINLSSNSTGAIKKSKSDRQKVIDEKRKTAHAKREAIKKNIEDKNAQKEKLLRLAQEAANPEDAVKLENDIAKLENDMRGEQMEIDKANQDIDMLDGEAGAIDKEADDGDGETGDSGGGDQEGSDKTVEALAEAFRKGLALDDTICTYKQADTTLRPTSSIIGYKQGSGHGRVAIVAEMDVKGHQIYRIRRDVIVSSEEVDIIQTRRTGTGVLGKGDRGSIKWKSDDIVDLIGIAIEVPPGYRGNPEDLVIPIPRLSDAEKEKKKSNGERLPKQADVQLIIRWKDAKDVKGISANYKYSFESRNGCAAIYGTAKKAAQVLYTLACTAEQNYRNNGGLYSVEEALPEFDALTPIGSRQGSEEPDGEKNDKEKAEDKKPEDEQKKQQEDRKKQEEEEEKRKLDEEKQKQKEKAESKKSQYEIFFRSQEGIDQNAQFTVDQANKFMEQYEKASAST